MPQGRSLTSLHCALQVLPHSVQAAGGGLPGRLVPDHDRGPEDVQLGAGCSAIGPGEQGQPGCSHVHQPRPDCHVQGHERAQVTVSLVRALAV